MPTTTWHSLTRTISSGEHLVERQPNDLTERYDSVLAHRRLNWTAHHRFEKLLGSGGQGVVFLTQRRGADGFTLPVALKIFSPEPFDDARSYDAAMERMAHVSARVAQIQHDNLLDVQNFVDRNRIRMLVMEWIDGFDLNQLLTAGMLRRIEHRVSVSRWEHINRVMATAGPVQPRFKPGVAVAIVRDCLGALAALHREDIVHGDIKPSNIMVKCTGSVKIVDIGSAFEASSPPSRRTCTPTYAAPEVLDGDIGTPRSDLASLGYVLVEMLAGQSPFAGISKYKDLLEAKRKLPHRLYDILPAEVTCNELLMKFCGGLIAPDPVLRFPSAEAADMLQGGAAAFHRQLIISDLASEYNNELRLWLEELKELEDLEQRNRNDSSTDGA